MITNITTDEFTAYLDTTFDRCASDMARLGLKCSRLGMELRSDCGALILRFEWVERATWGWTVSMRAYGYNIWGKEQAISEALEMARRNLQIASLAFQWDAELSALRFPEANITDPVKVAAEDARQELADEIHEGEQQASTDRRREVLAAVRDGKPLTQADIALARKMTLLIERTDNGYTLTSVGACVATEVL